MKVFLFFWLAVLVYVIIPITALPFNIELDGPCNSYSREKINEGYYKCVYNDPLGIPTIGVGFNLKKFGAKGEIESVGANYYAVLNGSQCLDDNQIETLFSKDMETAVSCASSWLDNWSSLGVSPQSAVADMAFNMGCATLHEFTSMRSAISQKDFQAAAADMKESAWCGQVGGRCSRDVDCMLN